MQFYFQIKKKTLEAGYMILPIQDNEYVITDAYGKRDPVIIGNKTSKDFHSGTDFAAKKGTPVRSTAKGNVIDTGYSEIYGNYIEIRHTETTTTFYAHLDSVNIKVGNSVKGGQIIGTVGSTGFSTGPHLHYEIKVNNIPINPHF